MHISATIVHLYVLTAYVQALSLVSRGLPDLSSDHGFPKVLLGRRQISSTPGNPGNRPSQTSSQSNLGDANIQKSFNNNQISSTTNNQTGGGRIGSTGDDTNNFQNSFSNNQIGPNNQNGASKATDDDDTNKPPSLKTIYKALKEIYHDEKGMNGANGPTQEQTSQLVRLLGQAVGASSESGDPTTVTRAIEAAYSSYKTGLNSNNPSNPNNNNANTNSNNNVNNVNTNNNNVNTNNNNINNNANTITRNSNNNNNNNSNSFNSNTNNQATQSNSGTPITFQRNFNTNGQDSRFQSTSFFNRD